MFYCRWQFYFGGVVSHFCGNDLDHCVMITGEVPSKRLALFRMISLHTFIFFFCFA